VRLNADEAIALDRHFHQGLYAPPIAFGVDKSETIRTPGMAGDDPRHLAVGDGVIRMESCKEHRAIDAGFGGAAEIFLQ